MLKLKAISTKAAGGGRRRATEVSSRIGHTNTLLGERHHKQEDQFLRERITSTTRKKKKQWRPAGVQHKKNKERV